MQGKISMDLLFCQAENGFSLDELVIKLADTIENHAYGEILKMILGLTQDILMSRIYANNSTMSCCSNAHLRHNGSFERKFRTSLGEFKMNIWRVSCSQCRKTFAPLLRFIKMERYQTKTNELEKLIIDTVSETSYRRGVEQLRRNGKIAISHRTAHDWIIKTDCDEIDISEKIVDSLPLQIMPDGTGFKGKGKDGKALRGDLKVVIGVTTKGSIFPLGSWAGSSWAEVNKEWQEQKVEFNNKSIVICDGELGLAEAFSNYANEQQRCHWHITRDLYYAMYQDGGSKSDSKPLQEALSGALAIELPQEDFKFVTEQEKNDIEEKMEKTEHAITQLISYLDNKGYIAAATYLTRAKLGMFGYVRRWLKWGLISPRASSMVERVMRELGRRIKKIAYNWSDRGVQKIAKIILKRFSSRDKWEEEWNKRMNIIGNVVTSIGNYKISSQDFAH